MCTECEEERQQRNLFEIAIDEIELYTNTLVDVIVHNFVPVAPAMPTVQVFVAASYLEDPGNDDGRGRPRAYQETSQLKAITRNSMPWCILRYPLQTV